MDGVILVFISIVTFLITAMCAEEFFKTKSSTNMVLMGIEFTLASIAFFLIRSNSHGDSDFIVLLLGTVFLTEGLSISIYGFFRK
ncbi:hypothetical protein KQI86_06140 [Clostridium sp. MSJ-11]|uniref:Uncharacterized protein n=1 Tax=Clostridium mobile TaxID=2841512 RepID=A0ABS6EFA8_9CLOT|nr:hypothetical protein [Clostridium mobile]MBU5483902.1 hypothetical protein [Clostridium mobile]